VNELEGLVIKTYDNLQSQIDQSDRITLSVTSPAPIESASVTLDSASSEIGESSGLMFLF
jgi:hypothetical protein